MSEMLESFCRRASPRSLFKNHVETVVQLPPKVKTEMYTKWKFKVELKIANLAPRSFFEKTTLDGSEILNQLRLVDCPIIYLGSFNPRWLFGISAINSMMVLGVFAEGRCAQEAALQCFFFHKSKQCKNQLGPSILEGRRSVFLQGSFGSPNH